jgi:acyl carrier protein
METGLTKNKIIAEQRVKEIIAEHLGSEESDVTPNASLMDDLGADSLDCVEIIMALEEEYGVSIPDEQADEVKTVRQAIDCVTRLKEKGK